MNWPFWSLSRPSQSESCESLEPLLSLYADGMASPEETRRIEAHLPGCGDCREVLSWMQATHRALAARPVVAPPANLHSRIAQAIAASSAASLSPRPARSFALRPAYAAAASLSVLGLVLSYSLRHSSGPIAATHTPPTHMASVPAVKPSSKHRLPQPVTVKQGRPLIASTNMPVSETAPPTVAKRRPAVRKAAPLTGPVSPERVALKAPDFTVPPTHPSPLPVKAPSRLPPHSLTASGKTAPLETRLPAVFRESTAPKLSEPLKTANRSQEPGAVPVTIQTPTVTSQPPVQTASGSGSSPSQLGDILGPVKAHIGQMRTVAYVTTRQSYRGAVTVMHALDTEHTAYIDGIHSP